MLVPSVGAGAEVAEALRQRVREETGVTCSVGVAPNRMLAKVPCFQEYPQCVAESIRPKLPAC